MVRLHGNLSDPEHNEPSQSHTIPRLRPDIEGTYDPPEEPYVGTPSVHVTQNFYNLTVIQTGSPPAYYTPVTAGAMAFTKEATVSVILLKLLSEMESTLGVSSDLEQVRAGFLSVLRELEPRKAARERCFSDLLTMIDVGLSYADLSALTKEGIVVLKDAVTKLGLVVEVGEVKRIRKLFRDNSIDILRPLRESCDLKQALKELFS